MSTWSEDVFSTAQYLCAVGVWACSQMDPAWFGAKFFWRVWGLRVASHDWVFGLASGLGVCAQASDVCGSAPYGPNHDGRASGPSRLLEANPLLALTVSGINGLAWLCGGHLRALWSSRVPTNVSVASAFVYILFVFGSPWCLPWTVLATLCPVPKARVALQRGRQVVLSFPNACPCQLSWRSCLLHTAGKFGTSFALLAKHAKVPAQSGW